MQKFKLRNKDLDTLMGIYRNSSMIFIKINQLTLHQFFYAYIYHKKQWKEISLFLLEKLIL